MTIALFILAVLFVVYVAVRIGATHEVRHYHSRVFCACGWSQEAPCLFHLHASCCPRCGRLKPRFADTADGWSVRIVRWDSGAGTWQDALDEIEKED